MGMSTCCRAQFMLLPRGSRGRIRDTNDDKLPVPWSSQVDVNRADQQTIAESGPDGALSDGF